MNSPLVSVSFKGGFFSKCLKNKIILRSIVENRSLIPKKKRINIKAKSNEETTEDEDVGQSKEGMLHPHPFHGKVPVSYKNIL